MTGRTVATSEVAQTSVRTAGTAVRKRAEWVKTSVNVNARKSGMAHGVTGSSFTPPIKHEAVNSDKLPPLWN